MLSNPNQYYYLVDLILFDDYLDFVRFPRSPRFKLIIACGAADPVLCFLVEEERHAAAKAPVELLEEFCIRLVVPHLEALKFQTCFFLESVDKRFHLYTVRALRAIELQEIAFRHDC